MSRPVVFDNDLLCRDLKQSFAHGMISSWSSPSLPSPMFECPYHRRSGDQNIHDLQLKFPSRTIGFMRAKKIPVHGKLPHNTSEIEARFRTF